MHCSLFSAHPDVDAGNVRTHPPLSSSTTFARNKKKSLSLFSRVISAICTWAYYFRVWIQASVFVRTVGIGKSGGREKELFHLSCPIRLSFSLSFVAFSVVEIDSFSLSRYTSVQYLAVLFSEGVTTLRG